MNPIALYRVGSDRPEGYMCSKCGVVRGALDYEVELSLICCDQEARDRKNKEASDAFRAKEAARMAEQLVLATKLPISEYGDDKPLFWGDTFFANLEELLEHCEAVDTLPPVEVWACYVDRLQLPGIKGLIDRAIEEGEHWDEIWDYYDRQHDQLVQEALDKWNQDQTAASWTPNFNVRVVL